tara:strand:+ start:1420 stop:2289 length:870 start_codon:yes stop_codon:yes gene_type:complete
MDIFDQILNAQKSSREDKVETFKSLFAEEDNVAVQTALAKARQVEEMERLKAKHEQEIEALKDEHERENERLAGAKEKETIDTAIQKKRDAERKANESVELDEGKLVANISDIIDAVMKKIKSQVGREIQKNQEKGLGMLNTLGSFVGAKVSDKKQEKGKLFLKWGDLEEGRNYKKEYENYHSKPEQIKRRAKRNEARRMLKNRKGIKGKDVHHKDNNPLNNDKSNLSIVSQKYNRTEPRLREKLGKDATIGDFIRDFKKSDAPQFKNQSAEEIKKMAVAAYYANQKRG